MSKFIDATTAIAIATFLWYRKGRLWNFYDSLLSKCTDQIKKDSMNRERWEQIALEQCDLLSKETFQSLFRFEVEYLRQKVLDNQYEFWIPDSEATSAIQITYTDKGQYCKHVIKKLFLSDFRFCGFRLFVNALRWQIGKKEDADTGYVKRRSAPREGSRSGCCP